MWWNDLINIRNGVGVGVRMWIDDNLRCELGDGASILFWWDSWLDKEVLKAGFSRLFLSF